MIDRVTLDAFAQVLVTEDLRAFQVAMAILSETKREQGETAFPDLGTILHAITEAEERWYRLPTDPPADREPVYANRPTRLTGDRLRDALDAGIRAIESKIRDIEKGVRSFNEGVPHDEIADYLEEPCRAAYLKLTETLKAIRTGTIDMQVALLDELGFIGDTIPSRRLSYGTKMLEPEVQR